METRKELSTSYCESMSQRWPLQEAQMKKLTIPEYQEQQAWLCLLKIKRSVEKEKEKPNEWKAVLKSMDARLKAMEEEKTRYEKEAEKSNSFPESFMK